MSNSSGRCDVAVVGMACRFPGGANSPEEFWRILAEGRDVVTEIDDARWSKDYFYHPNARQPGRSYTWAAGVLKDIDLFDADFFGISPREAAQMDPQQRILLELAWEALEDGAQVPRSLAGTDCGVFVGVASADYASSRLDDPAASDGYAMSGSALSITANRLSYVFDLHGPSMAIDTACSSSLVALHQACESLRRGESQSALVGGINLLLLPYGFVGFSKAAMLSPRGRCCAFDASADGYVRAEGGAVLFLKPLAQARADGDPIRGVIVASGVNTDGRTKGLALPSEAAQERLLRRVYGDAGLDPDDLAYVEAHGTGTSAGDLREATAIGRALGSRRSRDRPLPIGSVKTNVGHLEAASGMAGVLKSILMLERGRSTPTLHLTEPNPEIPFDDLNLELPTDLRELDCGAARPLIGVNSFGFGGANAHVVLARAESLAPATETAGDDRCAPLMLSARSEGALRELARSHADLLTEPNGAAPYAVAHSAARRELHPERLVAWAETPQEVASALHSFSDGGTPETGLVAGRALGDDVPVALLFSGNGSQWRGMGRELLRSDPVFARMVAQVDAAFRAHGGFSITDTLCGESDPERLALTEVAQPLLFGVQAGLVASLTARGLRPAVVLGHSAGEMAAAYVGGALSLEHATRLVHERSRLQAGTRGAGRMAALGLSPEETSRVLQRFDGLIELAACNSASSVTVSGPLAALEALGDELQERDCFFRILDLDYPFHSSSMDPLREPLIEALRDLRPRTLDIPMVSTVTGERVNGEDLGAEYWWQNIRRPVLLDVALASLLAASPHIILELGPHPVMQGYLSDAIRTAHGGGAATWSLHRENAGPQAVAAAAFRCHALGAQLDAKTLFPVPAAPVKLPAYPWQRERHWYEPSGEVASILGPRYEHPLLGYRRSRKDFEWECQLDPERPSYLADHIVGGATVMPASAFIEMALAAADALELAMPRIIERFEIRTALVLSENETQVVQFRMRDDDRGFEIRSRPRLSDAAWTTHVVGQLREGGARPRPAPLDLDAARSEDAETVSVDLHYQRAAACGFDYGPAFRAVSGLRVREAGHFVQIEAPEAVAAALGAYQLHPCLLDAALQGLIGLPRRDDESPDQEMTFLPSQCGEIVFYGDGAAVRVAVAQVTRTSPRSILADLTLCDSNGKVIAELRNFRFRKARLARGDRREAALYGFRWELAEPGGEHRSLLASGTSLLAAAGAAAQDAADSTPRRGYYEELLPLLDALVASSAHRAVRELADGRSDFTVPELMSMGGVRPEQEAWLRRLLGMLAEDGSMERQGTVWRFVDAEEVHDPVAIWRTLLAGFPGFVAEIALAGRTGLHLTRLLRGAEIPSDLSPSTDLSGVGGELLGASPSLRVSERATVALLGSLAAGWPASQRLRVLQLGGGSELAADVSAVLPAGRSDYVLACDPDDYDRYAADFSATPVEVCAVEVDRDLEGQGLVAQHFDVVLLPHLLHHVQRPQVLLASLRRVMAPDGLLVAAERSPDRFTDFVYGADPSWWRRRGIPGGPWSSLRDASAWESLLENEGFSGLQRVAEPSFDLPPASYLLLASIPGPSGEPAPEPSRRVLLVADSAGAGYETMAALRSTLIVAGHDVLLASGGRSFESDAHGFRFDLLDREQWRRCLETEQPVDQVVYLVGFDDAPPDSSFDPSSDPLIGQSRRCLPIVQLLTALRDRAEGALPAICVVSARTADAGAGTLGPPIPAQAALRGFVRVLQNEYPDFAWRIVDIAGVSAGNESAELIELELRTRDEETETVRTPTARYALRADRVEFHPAPLRRQPDTDERVWLSASVPGSSTNLRWNIERSPQPGPGEVQVAVRATGLNFRDVMYATGILPDEALEDGFAGATLGMECAGTVAAVGHDVTEFAVGDRVVCFAPQSFASDVVTPARFAAPIPEAWSFAEAATVPAAFFTAYYALGFLARIQPGERVLIHGAAGGVGLAAIQYARHCGAEIFATAGSDEKRDILRLLGVDHILDSRRLDFADQILEITGGEGVDVVLNSLAGEAMRLSLSVLRPFGRFLELGKRDFFENTRVGLHPFRDNITYHGVDADQLIAQRSELGARLFREVLDLFEQGAFWPLPHRVFPCTRVADAFRHMRYSRHIGKVVVTFDALPEIQAPPGVPTEEFRLDPEACYLVTGGLSGLGLETGRWLARKGARTLALLGRRGRATPGSREAIAEIERSGVDVHVLAVDVADDGALAAALEPFGRDLPAIRGVVHAAAVYDDRTAERIDQESFERVLAPTVSGAWSLHRRLPDVDFFVMYSSLATLVGNPGQASYVAANTYLEALAEYRRAQGLPAVTIGWGAIGDVGYLARNLTVAAALEARIGRDLLQSGDVMGWLERLIAADQSGVFVTNINWTAFGTSLPVAPGPTYQGLVTADGNDPARRADAAALVADLSEAEAAEVITGVIAEEIARVLRTSHEKIDLNRSVFELGMDSLMAIDLQLAVEERLGVPVPLLMLMDGPSAATLGGKIADRITRSAPTDAATEEVQELSRLATQHGFSDAELEEVGVEALPLTPEAGTPRP